MSRSDEDRKALDEAIIAVDAAINTLVLARITLERRIQEKPPLSQLPTTGCRHENVIDVSTMGSAASMCNDCGETV